MRAKLGTVLLFMSLIVFGCSIRIYNFADVHATNEAAGSVEVKVQVVKGIKAAEVPGSLATTFTIETKIVEGSIPSAPKVNRVKLKFYHDWTDALMTNGAIFTLRFAGDGELVGIKEIPRRIGKSDLTLPEPPKVPK